MLKTLRRDLKFSRRNFHSSVYNFQNTQVEAKVPQVGWEDKIKFWERKYFDVFGMTKLSEMHETVLETIKSIQELQEKRRKIQEELFNAQKKLQESQKELFKIPIEDSMYIPSVKKVNELTKEQERLKENVSSQDQTERDLQITLAAAIEDSEEHEHTQGKNNKKYCMVAGVAGSLLGFFQPSINDWRLQKEFKLFTNDVNHLLIALKKDVEKLNSDLKDQARKSQLELLHKYVRTLQSSNNVSGDHEAINDIYLDSNFRRITNQLVEDWDSKLNYHTSLNITVISSLLLFGSFLFYMSNFR